MNTSNELEMPHPEDVFKIAKERFGDDPKLPVAFLMRPSLCSSTLQNKYEVYRSREMFFKMCSIAHFPDVIHHVKSAQQYWESRDSVTQSVMVPASFETLQASSCGENSMSPSCVAECLDDLQFFLSEDSPLTDTKLGISDSSENLQSSDAHPPVVSVTEGPIGENKGGKGKLAISTSPENVSASASSSMESEKSAPSRKRRREHGSERNERRKKRKMLAESDFAPMAKSRRHFSWECVYRELTRRAMTSTPPLLERHIRGGYLVHFIFESMDVSALPAYYYRKLCENADDCDVENLMEIPNFVDRAAVFDAISDKAVKKWQYALANVRLGYWTAALADAERASELLDFLIRHARVDEELARESGVTSDSELDISVNASVVSWTLCFFKLLRGHAIALRGMGYRHLANVFLFKIPTFLQYGNDSDAEDDWERERLFVYGEELRGSEATKRCSSIEQMKKALESLSSEPVKSFLCNLESWTEYQAMMARSSMWTQGSD